MNMPHLKIKVQSLKDAEKGIKLFDDVTPENSIETTEMQVGIIEKGTQNGQDVLIFCMKNTIGEFQLFQMTENIFNSLSSAFKGAQERFKEENS